jgi:ABC-2 type transport system ATP-binding protein
MSNSIITVEGLTKSYGKNLVLDDLTFELPKGEIIGLLGPNGCGKTTFMKILTGIIHDYSGEVLIDGHKIGIQTKAMTAYIPERIYLAEWFKTRDAIDYFADFFVDFDKNKAIEFTKRFNLDINQRIKTMSKGMQEKVQLLLVMSRAAKLYVLDEPLGGVDPASRAGILDIIMKNYAKNSTLLLSTHLVNDLEQAFNHVIMLGGGKVLFNDSINAIKEQGISVEDKFREVFANVW